MEVYKSVPYGTVDSTLLYLTRRAQENRSVLERSKIERRLITRELFNRIKDLLTASSKPGKTASARV